VRLKSVRKTVTLNYEDRLFLEAERRTSRNIAKPLIPPSAAGIAFVFVATLIALAVPLSGVQIFLVCIFAFALPYLVWTRLEKRFELAFWAEVNKIYRSEQIQ
jgi:hypothetical protein